LSIAAIRVSELVGNRRIDPEYYQPHYVTLMTQLVAAKATPVESFADVTDGIHGSPEWVEIDGITYLSAKCVKDSYFVLTDAGQISQEQDRKNPRTRARVDDVLLTTVGTIGNAAVVYEDILPANMDRHLGIIRIRKNANVDPYYLSAFLNSELGRFQTWREATGNVQLNLFIEKIKTLLVPTGDYFNEVGQIVRKAYQKRRDSEDLYAQAQALLTAELGLDRLDLSEGLYSVRRASEARQARRIDAEHFRPKYYRVLDALKALRPKAMLPLGGLVNTLTNGHTPLHHSLDVGEVPFLTAEHVFDFRINFDSDKRILTEHHQTELARTQLHEGDVLITIKGRVGNAAVVEHLATPTNINQDVALLRLKPGYHPYYIAGFLNCVAGKALTEQICTGQINPFLGLGNLSQVLIPIFEESRMNELGQELQEKVGQAYQARQDAQRLLAEAKAEVERLIAG
jgi:hypothetical protein